MSQETYHENICIFVGKNLETLDSLARTSEQVLTTDWEEIVPTVLPALAMLIDKTITEVRTAIYRAVKLTNIEAEGIELELPVHDHEEYHPSKIFGVELGISRSVDGDGS